MNTAISGLEKGLPTQQPDTSKKSSDASTAVDPLMALFANMMQSLIAPNATPQAVSPAHATASQRVADKGSTKGAKAPATLGARTLPAQQSPMKAVLATGQLTVTLEKTGIASGKAAAVGGKTGVTTGKAAAVDGKLVIASGKAVVQDGKGGGLVGNRQTPIAAMPLATMQMDGTVSGRGNPVQALRGLTAAKLGAEVASGSVQGVKAQVAGVNVPVTKVQALAKADTLAQASKAAVQPSGDLAAIVQALTGSKVPAPGGKTSATGIPVATKLNASDTGVPLPAKETQVSAPPALTVATASVATRLHATVANKSTVVDTSLRPPIASQPESESGMALAQVIAQPSQGKSIPAAKTAMPLGSTHTISMADPNRQQVLNNIVVQQVQAGQNEVKVQIHPEGLGNIVISVTKVDGGVQVQMVANQMSTMQWLVQQSNQIADAVRTTGVDVSGVQVSFGRADMGNNAGGQPSKRQKQEQSGGRAGFAQAVGTPSMWGHTQEYLDSRNAGISIQV